MTITTGDRVPSATIFKMGADGGPEAVSTDDFFTTPDGEYVFDPSQLSANHLANQRAVRAIER